LHKPFCRKAIQKGITLDFNQSLSGYLRSDAIYFFAKEALKALGFQVKLGGNLTKVPKRSVIAGNGAEERAQDLNKHV